MRMRALLDAIRLRASGFTTAACSLLLRRFPVHNRPDLLLIHLNHTLADPMAKK